MTGMLLLRIGAVIAVLLLVLGYVHHRARALIPDRLGPRVALLLVFGLGPLGIVAFRALVAYSPELTERWRPVAYVGYTIALALLLAGALLLVIDAFRLAARLGARLRRLLRRDEGASPANAQPPVAVARTDEPAASSPPGAMPRREFLQKTSSAAAFAVGGVASLYGTAFGRHDYALEEVAVRVPGLPRSLDGYTIAQISDIHFGAFVREPELRAAVSLLRSARADAVVMTGDLLDRELEPLPLLGRLVAAARESSRDGVFAIPGNHEYYGGDPDAVLAAITRAGGTVLRNDGRVLGGAGGAFALLGVDDVWGMRAGGPGPDLGAALRAVPRDLPRVLLCHNPSYFPTASKHVALQLSGHTHGGQVHLGVNPAGLVLPHGYVAGLYARDGARLYVNRGFGTAGPPARVGSSPEVTKLVLVAS